MSAYIFLFWGWHSTKQMDLQLIMIILNTYTHNNILIYQNLNYSEKCALLKNTQCNNSFLTIGYLPKISCRWGCCNILMISVSLKALPPITLEDWLSRIGFVTFFVLFLVHGQALMFKPWRRRALIFYSLMNDLQSKMLLWWAMVTWNLLHGNNKNDP